MKQPVTDTPAVDTDRPPCLCGCTDTPIGAKSRWMPSHDLRAAIRVAEILDTYGVNIMTVDFGQLLRERGDA